MNEPYVQDHFYHIFNRGIDGMNIFYNQANYYFLLKKIKKYLNAYGVNLIAYCLMPNHYHFLVGQETDRPLSEWIQVIFNGYNQAINKHLNRHGSLFQGRAKHILIDTEAYLVHLARYIHFNPVAAGLVQTPEAWIFSNYAEWIGLRKGSLVNLPFVRTHFPNPMDYHKFVQEYAIEKALAEKLEKLFLDFE